MSDVGDIFARSYFYHKYAKLQSGIRNALLVLFHNIVNSLLILSFNVEFKMHHSFFFRTGFKKRNEGYLPGHQATFNIAINC